MSTGRSLYRIFDEDPSRGCHAVHNFEDADRWSRDRWGIFWTVNSFSGNRVKENCVKVLAWAVDIDSGSDEDQQARIRNVPITPSQAVKTARGYHLYFAALNGDVENYRPIVERMVERYGGDKNAKDVCRILRVPGYLHWKDPKNPKTISTVSCTQARFTEQEMRAAFPAPAEVEKEFDGKTNLRRDLKFQNDSGLWERIWSLDCEYALTRLSGTAAIGGDMISFKRMSNGNLNIIVNGKGTSCWIDKKKQIGSSDKGGPSIWQWVNWYHRDNKKTYQVLKEYLPEVFDVRP